MGADHLNGLRLFLKDLGLARLLHPWCSRLSIDLEEDKNHGSLLEPGTTKFPKRHL